MKINLKRALVFPLIKKATLLQKTSAHLGFVVSLGKHQLMGLNAPTELFLFKCSNCRYLSADWLHTNDRLDCHICND